MQGRSPQPSMELNRIRRAGPGLHREYSPASLPGGRPKNLADGVVWPLGTHHWHKNGGSPPLSTGTPRWLTGEQHPALLSHSHRPLHPLRGTIKTTKGLGRGLVTAGLLLLTSFLLHVKEDRASPTRLVCDNRLIQKYIVEAKDMEKKVGQCQALPALRCPAVLPLVDFTFQQWKSKSNETKRREILCDLALLLGAAAGAQGQVSDECGARQLSQLYRHANSFFLLLQTFSWEAGHWEPGCSPHSMEQTHISSIFLTYRQLVQGKLRFFFYDLAKVSCKQGQGESRDPPCGTQ